MEEAVDFVKGDDVHLIVQVGMGCAGDDHQLFVVALQFFESVFAEITGVRLLTVDDQYGVADFTGVAQLRHIHKG